MCNQERACWRKLESIAESQVKSLGSISTSTCVCSWRARVLVIAELCAGKAECVSILYKAAGAKLEQDAGYE